jgi:hypothetical protein
VRACGGEDTCGGMRGGEDCACLHLVQAAALQRDSPVDVKRGDMRYTRLAAFTYGRWLIEMTGVYGGTVECSV